MLLTAGTRLGPYEVVAQIGAGGMGEVYRVSDRFWRVLPFHLLLVAFLGWVEREQRTVIDFLREENRALKAQLLGHRIRLTDDQRRRLAVLGHQIGRCALRHIATLVTPDTILRWHRELVAQTWSCWKRRPGRPGVQREIRELVLRMASENPGWGYTRIQGALRNLGHRVARTTIAKIMKNAGVPPPPDRPTSWRTFLRAQWPALRAADFSGSVIAFLRTAGVHVVQTPVRAPNCNAHAERFVRSVKEECLNRVVPLGEWHRTLREFVTHYRRERNHQGLANELIDAPAALRPTGVVRRRRRVGSLSYYYRSAE